MTTRTMQFENITLGAISQHGERAEIRIDHAIIVKAMDDAEQETRWHGRGILIIEDLHQAPELLPTFPVTLGGADVRDNQMTYRNEVNIPFDFQGNVGISLHLKNNDKPLNFYGERMSFTLSEHEKYIEHIKP